MNLTTEEEDALRTLQLGSWQTIQNQQQSQPPTQPTQSRLAQLSLQQSLLTPSRSNAPLVQPATSQQSLPQPSQPQTLSSPAWTQSPSSWPSLIGGNHVASSSTAAQQNTHAAAGSSNTLLVRRYQAALASSSTAPQISPQDQSPINLDNTPSDSNDDDDNSNDTDIYLDELDGPIHSRAGLLRKLTTLAGSRPLILQDLSGTGKGRTTADIDPTSNTHNPRVRRRSDLSPDTSEEPQRSRARLSSSDYELIIDCYGLFGRGPEPDDETIAILTKIDQITNRRANRPRDSRPGPDLQKLQTQLAALQSAQGKPIGAMLFQFQAAPTDNGPVILRYLPLEAIEKPTSSQIMPKLFKFSPNAVAAILSSQPPSNFRTHWPLSRVPAEIFDIITSTLDHTDLQSMRLVCKDFESKVSRSLFAHSVVPFNTELYDMIDKDRKEILSRSNNASTTSSKETITRADPSEEDRLKASASALERLSFLNAKNDKDGKVYKGHGLRVFHGFGRHIRRFGMSFELSEQKLATPPIKNDLELVDSYFGRYRWPPRGYTRFADLAGLERTADEFSRMRAALSTLTGVRELALSVSSGLGWLDGPDKSIFDQVFPNAMPIFRSAADGNAQRKQEVAFVEAMSQSVRSFGANLQDMVCVKLKSHMINVQVGDFFADTSSQLADINRWPSVNISDPTNLFDNPPALDHLGVLYLTDTSAQTLQNTDKYPLVPAKLRKAQKEWLLETEWAQRAFLESYVLAVTDNAITFSNVTTLNLAKISSGFLDEMTRESFWQALSGVKDVAIMVSADWRIVHRDLAAYAEISSTPPSDATVKLVHILQHNIRLNARIKRLRLGYTDGGESATGILSRHLHVLPAPLCSKGQCLAQYPQMMTFPFLQDLTLVNCWMTPLALSAFVSTHRRLALKALRLHSFSLTANPALTGLPPIPHNVEFTTVTKDAVNDVLRRHRARVGQPNSWSSSWRRRSQMPASLRKKVGHFLNQLNNVLHTHSVRRGSWPHMLDCIPPGHQGQLFPSDFQPNFSHEDDLTEPDAFETLELVSVGYVRLENAPFSQQSFIDNDPTEDQGRPWMAERRSTLRQEMMTCQESLHGTVCNGCETYDNELMALIWHVLPTVERCSATSLISQDNGGEARSKMRVSGVITKPMPKDESCEAADITEDA